jgi:hypothetical protein
MIKIGTNFLYQGPLFLDSRHGIATSKTDLKNWSIPIPPGFEVYLNLENDPAWYTYRPDLDNPYIDTGYFERRLDKVYVDSEIDGVKASIANISQQVDDLSNAIELIDIKPNLTLDVTSNGGRRELGTGVYPNISWVLKNFGNPVDIQETTDVLINNVSIGKVSAWTDTEYITQDRTYLLTVIYKGHTLEHTISYTFEAYTWKKYFGTYSGSSLSSITNLSPSTPVSQGWGTGNMDYEGTLDCSGGKYPYYVIPTAIYHPENCKMYIGGFRTTDFTVATLRIGNTDYTTIRTGYIQSGILQLRYEG